MEGERKTVRRRDRTKFKQKVFSVLFHKDDELKDITNRKFKLSPLVNLKPGPSFPKTRILMRRYFSKKS